MGLVPCTDQNVNGYISVQMRMVRLYQAGIGTKAAVFQRWFLAVQGLVSLTHSLGRALEIQGGIQTSSAAGLSKYWEGRSIPPWLPPLWLPPSRLAGPSVFIPLCCASLCYGSCLERLIGTMECFARCNFKGHISHCATIKMQRVRRSLYFFAIQLLKCAEIRFICCNCQQLAVSYCS